MHRQHANNEVHTELGRQNRIYVDLTGNTSARAVGNLESSVSKVTLNDSATITMIRALKPTVTMIELNGDIRYYISSGLKYDGRVLKISSKTRKETVLNLERIGGKNHSIYLSRVDDEPIPVSLIRQIPLNIKTIIVSSNVSAEELRALGDGVKMLKFMPPIDSPQDPGAFQALLDAVPAHIVVYGISSDSPIRLAVLPNGELLTPMSFPPIGNLANFYETDLGRIIPVPEETLPRLGSAVPSSFFYPGTALLGSLALPAICPALREIFTRIEINKDQASMGKTGGLAITQTARPMPSFWAAPTPSILLVKTKPATKHTGETTRTVGQKAKRETDENNHRVTNTSCFLMPPPLNKRPRTPEEEQREEIKEAAAILLALTKKG